MGLKESDFCLSSAELAEINRFVFDQAALHAAEGEDPADVIRIVFEFAPVFGRSITVYFNGAHDGHSIVNG